MMYLVNVIYYSGCFAIGWFGAVNGLALTIGLFALNALVFIPIMHYLRK